MPEEQTPQSVQDPAANAPATPEPTPAPEAVAPAATPPEPTPPAPASVPDAPWTADLAEKFTDPTQRAAVDEYLREKVQPYVTSLEQSSKPAQELYNAFAEQPDDAFAEVASTLYGPEAAKAISDYVAALEAAERQETAQPPEQAQSQLPPEVQRLIERERAREEEEAFDSEFTRITAIPGNEGIDRESFIPFVAQHGSFEKAVDAYRTWEQRFKTVATGEQPTPPTPATPATAPPVVGSGSAEGGTPPPAQKAYGTLNEAIDDFFADQQSEGTPVAPPIPTS